MKNFLTKCLGYPGLAIYFVLAVIIRIPVAAFLLVYVFVALIILGPITKNEYSPRWVNKIFDWYCCQ